MKLREVNDLITDRWGDDYPLGREEIKKIARKVRCHETALTALAAAIGEDTVPPSRNTMPSRRPIRHPLEAPAAVTVHAWTQMSEEKLLIEVRKKLLAWQAGPPNLQVAWDLGCGLHRARTLLQAQGYMVWDEWLAGLDDGVPVDPDSVEELIALWQSFATMPRHLPAAMPAEVAIDLDEFRPTDWSIKNDENLRQVLRDACDYQLSRCRVPEVWVGDQQSITAPSSILPYLWNLGRGLIALKKRLSTGAWNAWLAGPKNARAILPPACGQLMSLAEAYPVHKSLFKLAARNCDMTIREVIEAAAGEEKTPVQDGKITPWEDLSDERLLAQARYGYQRCSGLVLSEAWDVGHGLLRVKSLLGDADCRVEDGNTSQWAAWLEDGAIRSEVADLYVRLAELYPDAPPDMPDDISIQDAIDRALGPADGFFMPTDWSASMPEKIGTGIKGVGVAVRKAYDERGYSTSLLDSWDVGHGLLLLRQHDDMTRDKWATWLNGSGAQIEIMDWAAAHLMELADLYPDHSPLVGEDPATSIQDAIDAAKVRQKIDNPPPAAGAPEVWAELPDEFQPTDWGDFQVDHLCERLVDGYLALRRRTILESWDLGNGLIRAKLLLDHGSWMAWLRDVQIDKSTANRLVMLAHAYPDHRPLMSDPPQSVTAALHEYRIRGKGQISQFEKFESTKSTKSTGAVDFDSEDEDDTPEITPEITPVTPQNSHPEGRGAVHRGEMIEQLHERADQAEEVAALDDGELAALVSEEVEVEPESDDTIHWEDENPIAPYLAPEASERYLRLERAEASRTIAQHSGDEVIELAEVALRRAARWREYATALHRELNNDAADEIAEVVKTWVERLLPSEYDAYVDYSDQIRRDCKNSGDRSALLVRALVILAEKSALLDEFRKISRQREKQIKQADKKSTALRNRLLKATPETALAVIDDVLAEEWAVARKTEGEK